MLTTERAQSVDQGHDSLLRLPVRVGLVVYDNDHRVLLSKRDDRLDLLHRYVTVDVSDDVAGDRIYLAAAVRVAREGAGLAVSEGQLYNVGVCLYRHEALTAFAVGVNPAELDQAAARSGGVLRPLDELLTNTSRVALGFDPQFLLNAVYDD